MTQVIQQPDISLFKRAHKLFDFSGVKISIF